jgi:hypothetical protein
MNQPQYVTEHPYREGCCDRHMRDHTNIPAPKLKGPARAHYDGPCDDSCREPVFNFNLDPGPLSPEEIQDAMKGQKIEEVQEREEITKDLGNTWNTLLEWQKVSLRKWEHYVKNVLPSGNKVAIAHWEHSLLKCIPFLVGRPDLALTMEMEEDIYVKAQQNRTAPMAFPDKNDAVRSILSGEPAEDWVKRHPANQEPCPTCSGPIRETVGMVCQTCGRDYAANDNPHRNEEGVQPYRQSALDFGPDGREYVGFDESGREQDC